MEHLRLFENYKSDEEIHKLCKEYDIENYTINKDGTIDVDEIVDLSVNNLTKFPLIFNKVNDSFNCRDNKLISLEGSPRIIKGAFWCYRNYLSDLTGGPDEVYGNYSVWGNDKLTSLEGIARTIRGNLLITSCNLSDFKGVSENFNVEGSISFDSNPVHRKLSEFLSKYDIDIKDIKDKYLDLILEINELDAIQNGEIVDIRMDEVLYNIGLI